MRTNPFQEKGNDAIIRALLKDPLQIPNGKITRSRDKRFKEALHGLIMTIQNETKETLLNLALMDGYGLFNIIQVCDDWTE